MWLYVEIVCICCVFVWVLCTEGKNSAINNILSGLYVWCSLNACRRIYVVIIQFEVKKKYVEKREKKRRWNSQAQMLWYLVSTSSFIYFCDVIVNRVLKALFCGYRLTVFPHISKHLAFCHHMSCSVWFTYHFIRFISIINCYCCFMFFYCILLAFF